MLKLLLYCFLIVSAVSAADLSDPEDNIVVECPAGDDVCEKDRIGFEAIHHLHRQIDDDQNGNLDRSESDEFIRDELKYEDGFDRHSNFHGTDDLISIDDLWKLWVQSEVYNWTVDDVADWLVNYVELPQYLEHVKVNAVDGRTLPRIAGNSQYVINILGIKSFVHRQKLSLKSMDLVLFGAPKRHNYIKDLALVASLLIACGGCWLAYVQNRYSQNHLRKVMKDLETLRSAEEAFTQLQHELEEAQEHKERVEEQKTHMEQTMKGQIEQAKTEADRLREQRECTEEEIQRLQLAEEELVQVRSALRRAEKELEGARLGVPLAELQSWLQLTYEIETKHYDSKRGAAERQLSHAKEMCEKIRKKRSAFLGSLRIAHTTSIDDTDHMIMSARAALEEMKVDLQERSERWQQIESICGFPIQQNPGHVCIEAMLRAAGHPNYTGGSSSLMSSRSLGGSMMAPLNMDDADEDFPPGALTNTVAFFSQPGRRSHVLSQSSPGRARREPRVWPHLMQAGMQLTMFGLGLTNSQAMHTMSTGMTAEKRSTSLASAFSGSTNSVGLSSAGKARPPLSTIPSQDSDGELPRSDSEDSFSISSSAQLSGTSANGVVAFDLGGPSEQVSDDRQRSNSVGKSYKTSVSVDSGTTRTMPRTRTLPTALSEGSFKGLPLPSPVAAASTSTAKPPPPVARVSSTTSSGGSVATPTPSLDDNSSPESTDGSSIAPEDRQKRKKKKNVFSKILGRDKQKTS